MKLQRSFFLQPATQCVKDFLGKKLVFENSRGRVAGIISEVEAYPAFVDEVSHGNKKTPRTEVMYKEGGYAYVYLIYGSWYQFAVVVNSENVPEVVFIRGVVPVEGIDIMRRNFGREVKKEIDLTNSPGKFCKSFGITKEQYGEDLTGDVVWLEDVGIEFESDEVRQGKRIGINPELKGADAKLRFWLPGKTLKK